MVTVLLLYLCSRYNKIVVVEYVSLLLSYCNIIVPKVIATITKIDKHYHSVTLRWFTSKFFCKSGLNSRKQQIVLGDSFVIIFKSALKNYNMFTCIDS